MGSPVRPKTLQEARDALAAAAAAGRAVRIVGAGTKLNWGAPVKDPSEELQTTALEATLQHNVGDLTAVLSAGVPLARAQRAFAAAGQMLALDPWLGSQEQATIGGILATGDSGPLRHRYGAPRDVVLGMTVVLSDGTIARSGGRVIKNVAGYDLAKLFCGSFGTLGLVLSVNLRLHPLPAATATAVGTARAADRLAGGARRLAGQPLELEALDVAWREGRGTLLAQCAGAQAESRARRAAELMRQAGLEAVEVAADDGGLWAAQRAGQRSGERAVVRVASRPSRLERVLAAARECGASLVGRAAVGESFLELDPDAVGRLRAALPPGTVAVLTDCPPEHRDAIEPWVPAPEAAALELMRRLKARFDPAGACNRGIFVGGI